jgi:hypothetical protein
MDKKDDMKVEDRDYLQGKDLSKVDDVRRTRTPLINEDVDSFKFMQIDVDYYTSNTFPGKFTFAYNPFRFPPT